MTSLETSVSAIANNLPPELRRWQAAVVLGSGLSEGDYGLSSSETIPYPAIPGLGATTVKGHPGLLEVGTLGQGGAVVAIFKGRRHLYETGSMGSAALTARIAAAMGAKLLITLSAMGATTPDFKAGRLVAVIDHINLMGRNPLEGVSTPQGPPFVDLSETYLTKLYEEVNRRAPELELGQGVLAAFSGPTYETPAEVVMAKMLGADLVGMSTVPEAIWAKQLGLDVASYGLVTNPAAGVGPKPLNHEDVVSCASSGAALATKLVETTLGVWFDNYAAHR